MKIANARRPNATPQKIFLSGQLFVAFAVRVVRVNSKANRRTP